MTMLVESIGQWHAEELLSGGCDKKNLPMGLV